MTDSIKTPKEKARFLYNYMQNNMRYVSIQLGIGGFKPFAATFVDLLQAARKSIVRHEIFGSSASHLGRKLSRTLHCGDSVELVACGNLFDGLVAIAGCDKNMPGTVMALCRLDIPSLMLYGGSIAPGHANGVDITIQDVFEGIGAHSAGRLDDAGLEVLEASACPGAGACGGQFTANTMAMACEFLGISPIHLSGVPATSPDKHAASRMAGRLVMDENAIVAHASRQTVIVEEL